MFKKNEHCNSLQVLKDAKLSRTSQRVAVLDMLINAERPLTVIQIFRNINFHQKIHKVTIYRILSSFVAKDIARGIPTDEGINYYEMACRHNPVHAHFYCKSCKKMFCLDPATSSRAIELFADLNGFKIEALSLNITGVCSNCNKGESF